VYLIGFNNGAMMNNDKALKAEFKYLDIIIVLFVLLLVLSNIAFSAKIIDWGFSLGSIQLS